MRKTKSFNQKIIFVCVGTQTLAGVPCAIRVNFRGA
jgi:hypothetical protein